MVISDGRKSHDEIRLNCNKNEPHEEAVKEEDSHRAVKENIPKNFTAALTLTHGRASKSRVRSDRSQIDRQIARTHIENRASSV